ncbi:Palmitoyl-acyl carrier protein thioesterase [Carex littledalei]|uniref:Acyl-[acyl-carrier-protein] hydrolase n=1 Tax=Carex littledalei TaxID=544730 RepID=A0A833RTJ4_9POAL|nr:Palmitoyl-acyl carrier protein thioesterase [Carex littledalei]
MAASFAAAGFFPKTNTPIKPAKNSFLDKPDVISLNSVPKPNKSDTKSSMKAQAQTLPKINGTNPGVKLPFENVLLEEPPEKMSSPFQTTSSKTFYNALPDWSVLLAAMMSYVFLAAEKQFTLSDWKPKRPEMLADAFGFGRMIQDGSVFRQTFPIRSYEIGADRTASIETLMNHLQETALNHVKIAGLLGDGFGATPEMSKRNLIWVVSRIQLLVEHYPSWGDVVEVDTWVGASGKNGMRRDWHVRDYKSGQTILRATSVWVMMNKETRRLAKMPEEVRAEIGPYFIERLAIRAEDAKKLPKAEKKDSSERFVREGLTPKWGDLDVNQHVNNVKYIGWILESAPISILEKHELASMTLEYRKECGRDSVLQSLTSVSSSADCTGEDGVRCEHLLKLESGSEIVKGYTEWRPKRIEEGNAGAFSGQSA